MARINISELNIKVTATSSGLSAQLSSDSQRLRRFAHDVRRGNEGMAASMREFEKILARTIALYATFRAAQFVKDTLFDSVKLAADAELAEVTFGVLMGSAERAKETIQELYAIVEGTRFDLTEVRDSAQLLASAGLQYERIIPTLKVLGDVSAGSGKALRDLAYLYATTRTEGRLYTRDLNQFLSANVRLLPVLANQFGVAENEIRGLASEGKIFFEDIERAFVQLTQEGGAYFQLTEKSADTLAVQLNNLKDKIDALKRAFGTGMIGPLKEVVNVLDEFVTGGGDAEQRMVALKNAGESLALAIRTVAGAFQYLRAGATYAQAGITQILASVAGLQELLTGRRGSAAEFLEAMTNSLVAETKRLEASAKRLMDLQQSLSRPAAEAGTGKSASDELAELIGFVDAATQRARNQLKSLREDAMKLATDISVAYQTPFEAFERSIEKLIKANIFGDLDDAVYLRAVGMEIDKLLSATQKLKDTLDNPAVLKGSAADIEARVRAANRLRIVSDDGGGRADAQSTLDALRSRIEQEAVELRRAAEATNQNTTAVDELTDSINEFGLEDMLSGLNQMTSKFGVVFGSGAGGGSAGPAAAEASRQAAEATRQNTAAVDQLSEDIQRTARIRELQTGIKEREALLQGFSRFAMTGPERSKIQSNIDAGKSELADLGVSVEATRQNTATMGVLGETLRLLIPAVDRIAQPAAGKAELDDLRAGADALGGHSEATRQNTDAVDRLSEDIKRTARIRELQTGIKEREALLRGFSRSAMTVPERSQIQSNVDAGKSELADLGVSVEATRQNTATMGVLGETLRLLIPAVDRIAQPRSSSDNLRPPNPVDRQTAMEVRRLREEMGRVAQLDRTVLSRVATASETIAKREPITVKQQAA